MCLCVHGSQQGVSDPPELEVQVFVDLWTWVLGTKLGSSGRAASVLNHCAVSPAPKVHVLI